jgi:DNA-binding XRE family transcriptional regulator
MKTTKWADLKAKMSPAAQREVNERVERTLQHLDDVRRARGMTQATLAETMGVSQGQIAKIESQSDLYLSTLRRFIEAMGGEMEIVARFPDGSEVGVTLDEEQAMGADAR